MAKSVILLAHLKVGHCSRSLSDAGKLLPLSIGSIDETTLTPTRSITGIAVPVQVFNPDGFQDH
ncbi:hypothetical protein YC2023_110818 [Brassica napus]